MHLLPTELYTQEPAIALAAPAGCSVVSSHGGCARPQSPYLKGTLTALISWAVRGFVRLLVKNHSGQVLSQWTYLVKGREREEEGTEVSSVAG